MLHTILIDDEQKCLDTLAYDLKQYCPQVKIIDQCSKATDALISINKHKPDLVFLDITLDTMDGFQLLECLAEITFEVIFVTGYDEHATKAFRVSAIDYLLKPIDKDDLQDAVLKVIQKRMPPLSQDQIKNLIKNLQADTPSQRIAFPSQRGYKFIPVQDIIYCNSREGIVRLHLMDGSTHPINMLLRDVAQRLAGYHFCRIHNSTLINLHHLDEFIKGAKGKGGEVIMSDKSQHTVARDRKHQLLDLVKPV